MAADDPRLAGYVTVDGALYGPDDDVPADVVEKLGEHLWVDGKKPASRRSKPKDDGEGEDGPPPMSGRGSSEDAWRAYAEKLEVDMDGVDSREGVIDAIRAAGHAVEKTAQ